MASFRDWLINGKTDREDVLRLRTFLQGKTIKSEKDDEIAQEINNMIVNEHNPNVSTSDLHSAWDIYKAEIASLDAEGKKNKDEANGIGKPPPSPPLAVITPSRWQNLRNDIAGYAAGGAVIGVVLAVITVFAIGMFNNTFMSGLSNVDRARGLITFLFSIGTISIFLIMSIVLFASKDDVPLLDRVDRAKDLLTILIGIFGTIVGFYFGSTVQGNSSDNALQVRPASVSDANPLSGSNVTLSSLIRGGTLPYTYSIVFSSQANDLNTSSLNQNNIRSEDGLIVYTFHIPNAQKGTKLTFIISAADTKAKSALVQGPEMTIQGAS